MFISFLFALLIDYLFAVEFKFLIFISITFFILNNYIYFPLILFFLISFFLLFLKPKYGVFAIIQFVITLIDYSFFVPIVFWFNNKEIILKLNFTNKSYIFLVFILFIFYFWILQIKDKKHLKIGKIIFIALFLITVTYFTYLTIFKEENRNFKNLNKKRYFFVNGDYLKKECVQWNYYLKPNKEIKEHFTSLIKNNSLICKSSKNLTQKSYYLIVLHKNNCFIIK